VFTLDELVRGETLFVATGVSGQLLRRPWQEHGVTWTESLMLKPGGRIMRVVESAGQVEGEAGSVGPSAAGQQEG
nr:fructose-bisphosphatase class II [Rubrobacter sp.]